VSTAVGPGCADLTAPPNGRIQYYMSADSSLHANVTCDDGYHVGAGGSFQHIRCTGVMWSSTLPVCMPGTINTCQYLQTSNTLELGQLDYFI